MYHVSPLLILFLLFLSCREQIDAFNPNDIGPLTDFGPDSESQAYCGNEIVEPGEACDGINLDGQDCTTIGRGYTAGQLRCSEDCLSFDTSGCSYSGESSVPSSPAVVEKTGTSGYLLKGVVLGPDGIIDPGEVLIVSDRIVCVAEACGQLAEASQATIINGKGVISPGLVDGHNHMSYNFLPEWQPDPPALFKNRYEWADDPQYEAHILPYTKHRSSNSHFCPASIWGLLRSLIHGTTTMQGQPSASGSCINGGVREANGYHGLAYNHLSGTIGSVRDIDDQDAQALIKRFTATDKPLTRYHVHMAEGYDGNYIYEEFDSWAGRDSRANRHFGVNLLEYGTSILIHAVPLTDSHIEECVETDALMVWSPSSNMVLYGLTAPIQKMIQAGLIIGLGPDWTVSGEDEMLSEMRFAYRYARENNISEITPKKLWEMSTKDGAYVLGMADQLGRLQVGMKADIALFGRMGPDPYLAVMESTAEDVRLVFIDGKALFGDQNLMSATARDTACEAYEACTNPKFLCVVNTFSGDYTAWDLSAFRTALYNILENPDTYDADKPPYEGGRGHELLELVNCQ